MKNMLSENMMRFGTKNLGPEQKRRLTLESVMQTINEHGLHREVRRRLFEQETGEMYDNLQFHDYQGVGMLRGGIVGTPTYSDAMIKTGQLNFKNSKNGMTPAIKITANVQPLKYGTNQADTTKSPQSLTFYAIKGDGVLQGSDGTSLLAEYSPMYMESDWSTISAMAISHMPRGGGNYILASVGGAKEGATGKLVADLKAKGATYMSAV
jgi:hypothetical protein